MIAKYFIRRYAVMSTETGDFICNCNKHLVHKYAADRFMFRFTAWFGMQKFVYYRALWELKPADMTKYRIVDLFEG